MDGRAKMSGRQLSCASGLATVLLASTEWLFRQRNVQQWSEQFVFCTFVLPIVLRTTKADTVSTSQLPKVLRTWRVVTPCHDRLRFAAGRRRSSNLSTASLALRPFVFWHTLIPECRPATTANSISCLLCPDVIAPAVSASPLFDPPEPPLVVRTPFSSATVRPFSHNCIFSLRAFSISYLLRFWSSHVWMSQRPSFFLNVLCHLSTLSEV